jgi:hypothetical protein
MVDGRRLTFGFHGIYQGTAVLYDRQTHSLWVHLTGHCYEGPLAGRTLIPLPTGRHTIWKEWRKSHPDTDVMAPRKDMESHYFSEATAKAGRSVFPPVFPPTIHDRDARLEPSALLYGIVVDGTPRAYPYASLRKTGGLAQERVAGKDVVVLFDTEARSGAVYLARLGGRLLHFEVERAGRFRDRETRSLWSVDGEALEGPSKGKQLVRLEGLQSEWYGWYANHPDTTIWGR